VKSTTGTVDSGNETACFEIDPIGENASESQRSVRSITSWSEGYGVIGWQAVMFITQRDRTALSLSCFVRRYPVSLTLPDPHTGGRNCDLRRRLPSSPDLSPKQRRRSACIATSSGRHSCIQLIISQETFCFWKQVGQGKGGKSPQKARMRAF
jgi:hypothetical protein